MLPVNVTKRSRVENKLVSVPSPADVSVRNVSQTVRPISTANNEPRH